MRTSFVLLLVACAAPAAPVPPDSTPRDREGNPLPKGATARLGSLAFTGSEAYGLTFSEDGKTLYASHKGRVYSWDATTGNRLPTVEYTKDEVSSLVVAGRVFVTDSCPIPFADQSCTVFTFDRLTGKTLSRIRHQESTCFAAYSATNAPAPLSPSADGKTLALVTQRAERLAVIDTTTGKVQHEWACADLVGCALAPDGGTVYARRRSAAVARFDVKTGKALADLAGTDEGTELVVPSPDDKRVVTGGVCTIADPDGGVISTRETFVRVHDTAKNVVARKLELGGWAGQMEWGGGALFVRVWKPEDDGPVVTLERWNVTTGAREWRVPLSRYGHRFCVSADGSRVALSADGRVIRVLEGATGKPLRGVAGHSEPVCWIGWSPDGNTVRTAAGDGIVTWALDGKPLTVARPDELRRVQFPPFVPGTALVWPFGYPKWTRWELHSWNFEKGAIGWRAPLRMRAFVTVLSCDGKGATVVWHDSDDDTWAVARIDGATGKARIAGAFAVEQQDEPPRTWPGLAQSGDGNTLYVAQNDARALDLRSGKVTSFAKIGPMPTSTGWRVERFAVSPDGARVAFVPASHPPRLAVTDVKTGKELAAHVLGDVDHPILAFNATGTRVAVWSNDGTLFVSRADANEKPLDFTLENMHPTCAAFSPNGASLAVGYQDGTALVWDVTGKPKE